jgi:signal transduction histidine kinase/ActR/RegA family two-component response regulator
MKLAKQGAFPTASAMASSLVDVDQLRLRLAAMSEENATLREAVAKASQLHAVNTHNLEDMRASHAESNQAAVASNKKITKGRAALKSSRAETKIGRSDLLASIVALALSRKETSEGQTDLEASELANKTLSLANDLLVTSEAAMERLLASAREETSLGRSDLLETIVALALSRKETSEGQTDLVASELANKILSHDNELLATSEATLERLVEERTAALIREVEERRRAEETLRQGEKMQAIGQITGGIAHDFNNLLQVFMTGVGLLRRPGLSDAIREPVLDKMDFAVESAAALISRLLTFARKQALRPEVFDLNLRVEKVCELLTATLGASINLQTDFTSDLWPVIADPNQLDIAILNLAVNARDAMLPDGGALILRTYNVSLAAAFERPAGDYVCLAVEDSGSGMSPAVLARVFEPFFTTKMQGKGTGLGLAQVYGFAKQSGGEVAIESVPGRGTVVLLHLLRPTAETLIKEAKREENMATQSIHHITRTVLVVEDNLDLGNFTASMLEELGYATKSASNATEALAVLESGELIDGVFSDVSMPGPMNGLRLASTLRRLYPRLAVLLATGYSQALVEGEQPAEAEVLGKPYRRHDLKAALQRAFVAVE